MKQFNKTEIKHFHPEGKLMPNGSHIQKGGYLNDCKNNFNSFVLDDGVYAKQHSMSKCSGGIIVFPVSANLGQSLSNYDAFLSAIRLFIETHKSLFHKEGIIPFLNFRGSVRAYSIGEFFKGRYVTSNGELFNESSVCIEIDGLSSKSLFQICEMISEQFQQKTVLIKDLTKNMIYLSNSWTFRIDVNSNDRTINAEIEQNFEMRVKPNLHHYIYNNNYMENKIMKIESTKEFNEEGLNSLTGQENNIKTFCIIIGESSIVRTIKPKRKPKTITQPMSLTDSLKSGNFAWLNIRGKYDIDKTPKIIFNIPLSTAKCFGLKYSHQPFIFGRIIDGKLNFELYLINAEKTDYNLEDVDVLIDININTLITDTMIDIYKDSPITEQSPNMVAALFTYISNKYKLNIPFEYFKEACNSFNNRINEIKNKHPRYKEEYDICLDASLCESRNGKSQYLNRSLIYGGLFR